MKRFVNCVVVSFVLLFCSASAIAQTVSAPAFVFIRTIDGSGHVFRSDAVGGEVDLTAELTSPDAFDVAGSPDGTRVAYSTGAGLYVMNADGTDKQFIANGFEPAWRPDGQRIAFTSLNSTTGAFDVRESDPDGANAIQLISDARRPRYSPDAAKIVYKTSTNSEVRLFTIATATSARVGLLNLDEPDFIGDGSRIIVSGGFDTDFILQSFDLDGLNPVQIVREPQFLCACPSPAPAGLALLYGSGEGIKLANIDGSEPRLVTTGGATDSRPSWLRRFPAPTSEPIVFVRDGFIYKANSDGSDVVQLTTTPGAQTPALSPDGQLVAYAFGGIRTVNIDGTNDQPLANQSGPEISPAWSPDGTKLAFFDLTTEELFVSDADGANRVLVASGARDPDWASDGQRLVYRKTAGFMEILTLASGAAVSLPDGNSPAFSPDGSRIVYENSGLRIVNADGTGALQVAADPALLNPDWSADGTRIIAHKYDVNFNGTIVTLNPDGLQLSDAVGAGVNASYRAASVGDAPNHISFSALDYSVNESAGTVVLTVTRTGGLADPASASFATFDGTAVAPGDYAPTAGTIVFAAGEDTKTITIPVFTDAEVEPNETFGVTMTATTPTYSVIDPTATVTLVDEITTLGLESNAYQVRENGGPIQITVVRGGNVGGTSTVAVSWASSDANPVQDFVDFGQTLTFAPGETAKSFNFVPVNDAVQENTESVVVIISTTDADTQITQGFAGVTILDNDQPSAYSFDSSASGFESAGPIPVVVRRVGGEDAPGQVRLNAVECQFTNCATAGTDFSPIQTNVQFAVGQTTATVNLPIIDDNITEPQEFFVAQLSPIDVGSTVETPSSVGITIYDDDVTFNVSGVTVTEGDEGQTTVANVVVTRTSAGGPATVDFATEALTATAGEDYGATTGVLLFNAGELVKQVPVSIFGDNFAEANEQLIVRFSNPAGGRLGSPTATITITDDEPAFTLNTTGNAAVYNVNEVDGGFQVRISRAPGSALKAGSVDYSTIVNPGDDATPNVDFTAVSGTLAFAAGETEKFVAIPLLADALNENTERFHFAISPTLSGANGRPLSRVVAPSSADVNVYDGLPRVGFDPNANYQVVETAGSFVARIVRNGNINMPATVGIASADITATAGSDYTAVSSTISFAPFEVLKTVTIPIANDGVSESPEEFSLTLSNLSVGTLDTPSAVNVEIVDPAPQIRFGAASYRIEERSGPLTVQVVRFGNTSGTATVQYATANNTAVSGADYVATSGTLTFAPGDTTKNITIPIVDNDAVESAENFRIQLSGVTGATLLTPQVFAQIDDDDSSVGFSTNQFSVAEDAGSVTLSILRTGVLSRAVSVRVRTSNGSAVAGSDYEAVDTTVAFAAGVSTATVTIPITDDLSTETNEIFGVALTTVAGSGATPVGFTTATVTILDNDPRISLSANAYAGDEGTDAIVTVVRSGNNQLTSSVDYQTSNGTALAGSDYVATSGTLTFNAGETQKTIAIPLIDDGVTELGEYFRITLSNPNGALVFSPSVANVNINASPALFAFTASDANAEILSCSPTGGCVFADYLVRESAAAKTITVTRSGNATIAATVDYATSPLTATAGTDYSTTSGTLSFAPGETVKTFVVPIVNDAAQEGNENFNVTLSNPSSGALINNAQRKVYIRDSFTGFIFADSTAAGYTASSGGTPANAFYAFETFGAATIRVTRVGDLASPATVHYATGGGTATPGADYTPTSGDLTFAAGEAQKTFAIPIVADAIAENDETVNFQLQYVAGETAVVNGTGTLTIQEAIVGFPCEGLAPCRDYHSNTLAESSGFIDIPVTIEGFVGGPVVVNYATEDATATAGADYVATSGQLTLNSTTRRVVVRVPLIDDGVYEANETFRLRLTSIASGAAAIETNGVANVTITDASLSVADASAGEGSTALVRVTRTGDPASAVTVGYATTATGTATPNVDFTPVSGTLSFAAGETLKTISVPTIDDDVYDTGETIGVVISNPTGEGAIADGEAVVTLADESPARVAFTKTNESVNENGGPLTFSLTRTSNLTSSVTVNVRSASGSATEGVDFGAVDQTIAFAPGETVKTLDIPIIDDALAETSEDFTLTLSVVSGESTVGGPARVTIVDPTVRFRGSSFAANENAGTATVFVVLEGAPQTPVTINYATVAGGTATPNVDYTPVSGQLSFAIGDRIKSFEVPVTSDAVSEGIEFINLALSNPTGETSLGTPATARLSLTETRPNVEISGWQLQTVKSGGLFSGRHLAGIAVDGAGNVFVAADDPTNAPNFAARDAARDEKTAAPLAGTETQYFDLYRIAVGGAVTFVGRYDVLHYDLVNMVFGPDGALYTAGSDAAVYRIDTATAAISAFNSDTGLSYFRAGVDFDASGNLILMTEAAPNSFYRIPAGTGSVFLGSYALDNYGNYGTRFNVAPDGSYVIYPDGPAANNPRVTRIQTSGHTPGTPFTFEYLSPTNIRTLGAAFGHSFGAVNPANGGVFSSGGNFGDGSSVILYTPPGAGSALASTTVRAVSGIGNGVADGGDNLAARGVTAMAFGARRDAVPGKALYFIDDFDDTVYQLIAVAPTAANVSLSGRVLTNDGRGLANAVVTLTKSDGTVVSARSTSFGAFRFNDLVAGETVVVSVVSRKFIFTPRVVQLAEDVADFNLTADSAQ